MATTLPVPVELSLPQGWRSVPPDGPSRVEQGLHANITITGELRGSETPLSEVADEALGTLRRGTPDVRLGKREEVAGPDNPAVTQSVGLSVPHRGKPLHIVRRQAFLGMRAVRDPGRRSVPHVVLSRCRSDSTECSRASSDSCPPSDPRERDE